MSEETASGETGQAGPDTGSLAMDLAMEEARCDPSLRNEAAAFLRNQSALVDIQKHHLHEQFKQLRLATLSQRLTVALKLATGAVGIGIIAALGVAVWIASQADGLVVEPFSVPPQFAQAGITGEVLSDDLNTKLGVIRETANARSLVRSGDISANRSDDIKVEIPETGISLGQAWRYLRLWFGHEQRLRGNLRTLEDGKIALSVALDDAAPLTVTGPSSDLDKLEQQAAEHAYGLVAPGNFAIYLDATGRSAQAYAVIERQAPTFSGLWVAITRRRDVRLALQRAGVVVAAHPTTISAHRELAIVQLALGHNEEALQEERLVQSLQKENRDKASPTPSFSDLVDETKFFLAAELGDFLQAAGTGCLRCSFDSLALRQAEYFARAHDTARSRLLVGQALAFGVTSEPFRFVQFGSLNRARYYLAVAMGDWRGAVAEARAYIGVIKADAARAQLLDAVPDTITAPMLSLALAQAGDFRGAHAAADELPGDCYHCLRVRGQIAALEKNWSGADDWFARAVKAAPSIPFAYADWGQALQQRGQPDAAIEKFVLANQKGPHFADALEYWGEALMAKNQSHRAVAKFAEATQYAPNWGRLHLKWGEALVYAGKKAEAQKHFARAAALDLTPSEKTELARFT